MVGQYKVFKSMKINLKSFDSETWSGHSPYYARIACDSSDWTTEYSSQEDCRVSWKFHGWWNGSNPSSKSMHIYLENVHTCHQEQKKWYDTLWNSVRQQKNHMAVPLVGTRVFYRRSILGHNDAHWHSCDAYALEIYLYTPNAYVETSKSFLTST